MVLMSDSITATTEYNELLDCIKQTLATGQLRAARVVNNLLVETYWQIGREIVTRQRKQGWGARVIERLSADLRTAHPDVRGLSVRNLRYMAALATRWPTEIVQCGVAQLPWSLVASLLDNPKVEIVIDDGRRWLNRHPERKFDAIIQNTTWYYRPNVTNLLSREYLALVAAHLREGGVIMYNTTGSLRVQRTLAPCTRECACL